MVFEKFSLYLRNTKCEKFVENLANGKITATKCKKCSTEYYPPRMDCPTCISSEMEWIEISAQGKLAAYTEIHIPPEHFTGSEPYIIGLIELSNGLRIMGRILGANVEELKIGMEMKAIPREIGDKVTIVLESL